MKNYVMMGALSLLVPVSYTHLTVVRQSAMNINTMNVTNKMPSTRLRDTVWTARFTRFSRS